MSAVDLPKEQDLVEYRVDRILEEANTDTRIVVLARQDGALDTFPIWRCNLVGPPDSLPDLHYPRCVEAAEHIESRRLAGKTRVERYRHTGSTGNLIHSIAKEREERW